MRVEQPFSGCGSRGSLERSGGQYGGLGASPMNTRPKGTIFSQGPHLPLLALVPLQAAPWPCCRWNYWLLWLARGGLALRLLGGRLNPTNGSGSAGERNLLPVAAAAARGLGNWVRVERGRPNGAPGRRAWAGLWGARRAGAEGGGPVRGFAGGTAGRPAGGWAARRRCFGGFLVAGGGERLADQREAGRRGGLR